MSIDRYPLAARPLHWAARPLPPLRVGEDEVARSVVVLPLAILAVLFVLAAMMGSPAV